MYAIQHIQKFQSFTLRYYPCFQQKVAQTDAISKEIVYIIYSQWLNFHKSGVWMLLTKQISLISTEIIFSSVHLRCWCWLCLGPPWPSPPTPQRSLTRTWYTEGRLWKSYHNVWHSITPLLAWGTIFNKLSRAVWFSDSSASMGDIFMVECRRLI